MIHCFLSELKTVYSQYENLVVPRSEKSVVGTEDGIQGEQIYSNDFITI